MKEERSEDLRKARWICCFGFTTVCGFVYNILVHYYFDPRPQNPERVGKVKQGEKGMDPLAVPFEYLQTVQVKRSTMYIFFSFFFSFS